jgi:hypothetical protein
VDPLTRLLAPQVFEPQAPASGSVNNCVLESVRSRKASTSGALLRRDEAKLLKPRLDRAQRASVLARNGGRRVGIPPCSRTPPLG